MIVTVEIVGNTVKIGIDEQITALELLGIFDIAKDAVIKDINTQKEEIIDGQINMEEVVSNDL